jgi:hypothetical protein
MNKTKNRLSNCIAGFGLPLDSFLVRISNRLQTKALRQNTAAKPRLARQVMTLDFVPAVPYGDGRDSPSNMEKALKATAAGKYFPTKYRHTV